MAVRKNAATIPVTRERQVRRIAAVCDMHRAPFGSASDLMDFLRALDNNKHLAMDFWAIVAKMTDEQSSQPSSRSLNAWILELIVEGVTNCSVAEMMAMAGEPRQAVGQLASLLAGEDMHRPGGAGPHVDQPVDFGSQVAGPGAGAVASSVESPEFFKAPPSKPPQIHDELKVAATDHEVGEVEGVAEARDRSAVESLPPPSPSKDQSADLHAATTPAAPTGADVAPTGASADASTVEDAEDAGRRKAIWRWADSVTREEQQRPRLVLEPNTAAVGEVLPELRAWAPASLQGPGPVSFQVSVPGAAPITVQVSLQSSGQLSVQTYEDIPAGSFNASGFRAKYMAAEQNARLLDDRALNVGPATLRPGRPLFEGYGDEERRPRWIWLALVMLALGGVTGLVIAKYQLPTWQQLEASMLERYGAAIWQTSPEARTDEAGQSSIRENPPAAATPTASQPAGGSSSATGSAATGSTATGPTATKVEPKPASSGAVRGAGSGAVRTRPARSSTAVDAPSASATTPPASNGAVPVDGALMAVNLISSRVPTYPEEARANGVEGRVVLQANILKSGAVGHLHVTAGDPVLRGAALEAVSKWRYRPYLVSGEPVDVITTIVVDFNIGQ